MSQFEAGKKKCFELVQLVENIRFKSLTTCERKFCIKRFYLLIWDLFSFSFALCMYFAFFSATQKKRSHFVGFESSKIFKCKIKYIVKKEEKQLCLARSILSMHWFFVGNIRKYVCALRFGAHEMWQKCECIIKFNRFFTIETALERQTCIHKKCQTSIRLLFIPCWSKSAEPLQNVYMVFQLYSLYFLFTKLIDAVAEANKEEPTIVDASQWF